MSVTSKLPNAEGMAEVNFEGAPFLRAPITEIIAFTLELERSYEKAPDTRDLREKMREVKKMAVTILDMMSDGARAELPNGCSAAPLILTTKIKNIVAQVGENGAILKRLFYEVLPGTCQLSIPTLDIAKRFSVGYIKHVFECIYNSLNAVNIAVLQISGIEFFVSEYNRLYEAQSDPQLQTRFIKNVNMARLVRRAIIFDASASALWESQGSSRWNRMENLWCHHVFKFPTLLSSECYFANSIDGIKKVMPDSHCGWNNDEIFANFTPRAIPFLARFWSGRAAISVE